MKNTTLLVLALAGILLGACGDDGGEVGAGSPTSTSSTSTRAPATSTTSTVAGPALNASSTLDLRGLGPIRVGMTLAEATAAAGVPVVASTDATECTYARADGGPDGVLFMVIDGHIARIDVRETSPVETRSGAGIGDTETKVEALYPGIEVSVHKYVPGGHYLTLVPTDPADVDVRLIFETDASSKVTTFRSGRLPEVAWVEGCA